MNKPHSVLKLLQLLGIMPLLGKSFLLSQLSVPIATPQLLTECFICHFCIRKSFGRILYDQGSQGNIHNEKILNRSEIEPKQLQYDFNL